MFQSGYFFEYKHNEVLILNMFEYSYIFWIKGWLFQFNDSKSSNICDDTFINLIYSGENVDKSLAFGKYSDKFTDDKTFIHFELSKISGCIHPIIISTPFIQFFILIW